MKKRLFKVAAILTMITALISSLIGSIKAENTFAKENTGSEGVTIIILNIPYQKIMMKKLLK